MSTSFPPVLSPRPSRNSPRPRKSQRPSRLPQEPQPVLQEVLQQDKDQLDPTPWWYPSDSQDPSVKDTLDDTLDPFFQQFQSNQQQQQLHRELPSSLLALSSPASLPTAAARPTRQTQPSFQSQWQPSAVPLPFPNPPPETDDEDDASWLVIIVLSTVLIITIVSVIRSCGQKAGWLTGSDENSNGGGGSRDRGRGNAGRRGPGGANGGMGYSGSGPHPVQLEDAATDFYETEERLAQLTDTQRQAYDVAKAFQIANPPNSVPTDISLSQYLSIQEKGVSAWEFEASYDHQLFVHDRTELSFFDREACVQTNLPLPKQQEVYYWEVKMFEKSPQTTISIGVSTKPYPTSRLPGWNRFSVGYFSHNGQKYCNSPWSGYPYGPIYFEGDVIGCGYRPRNGNIFFTRNGRRIEDAYTGFGRTNLFPTVGATGPCVLHVNFGQSGFVFVEANVKKWGLAPASGSLAPPPAYGSELGSILLEASGSAGQAPNSRLPRSLSNGLAGAGGMVGAGVGALLRASGRSGASSTGSSTHSSRRPILQSSQSRSRIQAAGALQSEDGAVDDNSRSSPVHISLGNMSAPPPHYSSLDRYGNEVTGSSGSLHRQESSAGSTESVTLLLGDAVPDVEEEDEEEDEEAARSHSTPAATENGTRRSR
ncbi:Ran-binding protein 9/10 [Entomortierella parvispora]|uniref:Ran-binding protein 9/10 n=1 Tax=Entomortierella parvispora TaxID=205924 RepID=A0A9P3GYX8_9FUNG|nr:Ran-binding protein 9/10 [Entomortierella parvispora]